MEEFEAWWREEIDKCLTPPTPERMAKLAWEAALNSKTDAGANVPFDRCPDCDGDFDLETDQCGTCEDTGECAQEVGLAKLVTLQDQYIKFIGEELEETAILAAARGWKSKRFDEGVKLRTEMERLKGKLG